MAVAKTTNEVKLAIERKTAKTLPDQPTARGYTAATIKGALYKWLSDPKNSLFAELDRIVDAFNAEIADVVDGSTPIDYDNAISELVATTIQGALDEIDGNVDTNADAIANIIAGVTDIVYSNVISGLTAATVKAAIDEIDAWLDDLMDGTQTVDKATKDASGNTITTTYEKSANKKTSLSDNSDTYYPSQKAVKTAVDARVPLTRTIIGLGLQDDVLLAEFKTAIGNATTELAGLMSATDKSRLDALHGILGEEADVDEVVNTINEILAIFDNYPEGVDLVAALAGKVDKVEGKELSDNNYTDAEAAKVGHLPADFEAFIADYYTKAQVDTLLDQLTTAYGLSETAIDELEDDDTIALADLTTYDYITLVLKHTDTHFIFDGKLIDPASFVNANDVIQLNAFEGGTQKSYGSLTYDGSTNLTFEASDALDTLVIKGYKKDTVTGLLVEETFSGTTYLDAETNSHDADVALDVAIKANADDIDDLLDGTQIALKASQDDDGNDIVATYATKTALAVETLRNAEQAKQLADLQEFAQKALANEVSATVDDDGTGIASLGKDVARAPLSVKVEGRLIPALENLVTNGDFGDEVGVGQLWYPENSTNTTLTNPSNELNISTSMSSGAIQEYFPIANNVYLVIGQQRLVSGTNTQLRIRNYADKTILFIGDVVTSTSFVNMKLAFTTTVNRIELYLRNEGATVSRYKQVHLFNLTASHGVTATSGTAYDNAVADIEAMLALNGGYISTTALATANFDKRVKAVGKNLFDKSKYATSYAYKIKVKPSTAYVWTASTAYKTYDIDETELVSATGTTVTTCANAHYIAFSGVADTDAFQLELGSTATTYAPFVSSEQYLFGNAEGYSLPNGTKDSVEFRNGKAYYIQRVKKYALTADDVDAVTDGSNLQYATIGIGALSGIVTQTADALDNEVFISDYLEVDAIDAEGETATFVTDTTSLYIQDTLATWADLAAAKTALAGTIIYYQLATPVETLIEVSGNLQGHPNGTVYVEDATYEVLAYSSGLTTAHDISSVIECVKLNADGTQTVIANSAVTLTSNQVSAITSASAGEIYYIAYYYTGTYCKGLTTVTYYDDRMVVVDSVDSAVYKITPSIADGVLTWDLTEV